MDVFSTDYFACSYLKLYRKFTNVHRNSLGDLIKVDREKLPMNFSSASDINGCSLLACYLETNLERNEVNQRQIVCFRILK